MLCGGRCVAASVIGIDWQLNTQQLLHGADVVDAAAATCKFTFGTSFACNFVVTFIVLSESIKHNTNLPQKNVVGNAVYN